MKTRHNETHPRRVDVSGLWAGLIALAGFALRMFRLTYQSIWWDEAHTIYVARQGWLAVWNLPNTVSYNHPPLHYGFMVAWERLAGISELAVRYPSVLFGILLVPLTYAIGRRWFDRATGLAAAGLAAAWPVFITYSQEARVYALLPVLYLAMLYVAHRIVERRQDAPLRLWVLLAVVELTALLAHYFMALAVLVVNVVLLAGWGRGRRVKVGAWIGSQLAVGLIFGGWAVRLLPNLGFLQADLAGSQGPGRWGEVARRIGLFIGGGYPAADNPGGWLAWVAVIAGIVSAAAVAVALIDRRQTVGRVLLEGLGPLAVAVAIFWWAPQSQPRYLIALVIPLVVALAATCVHLLRASGWRRALGGLTAVALAALCASGWAEATFDPATFKDDERGAAAYLEEVTRPGDIILASPNDKGVAIYYDGPAQVSHTTDQGFDFKVAQMVSLGRSVSRRFFLADWERSTADLAGLRGYLLERAGRLEHVEDLHGIDVWFYTVDRPVEGIPVVTDAVQPVGPLTLTGYHVDRRATNDDAVTAVLRWRLDRPDDCDYRISVRLVDEEGRTINASDRTLLDEQNLPTSGWERGEVARSFAVVPVPVGWMPGTYRLQVRVYDAGDGQALAWADGGTDWTLPDPVTVVAGRDFATDPYGTWADVTWQTVDPPLEASDVRLAQVAFDPAQGLPGQPISALLWWEITGPDRPDALPGVELAEGDRVWSTAEATVEADDLPVADVGTVVAVERRWLTYPPRRGPVTLRTTDGQVLGTVALNVAGLGWDLPRMAGRIGAEFAGIGTLAGYEISARRVQAGDPLTVTLIWQAGNDAPTSRPYTVFTQLLTPDGRLIAQHDGPPATGSRPTTSWIGGEVIVDAHTLDWQDTGYSGPARLIVGLYDSETIERVRTGDGSDYVEITGIRVRSAK